MESLLCGLDRIAARAVLAGLAGVTAIALTACGSGGGGRGPAEPMLGPPALTIISGQGQTARAGDTALGRPVVGQLVRRSDGTVGWVPLTESITERALDLLVPRAFAQTVVRGSPVIGAVVCAVSPDTLKKLVPFVPCTNTDSLGKATFFFSPGTHAGQAYAEIRGTVVGQPTVFDTARATVTPGAPYYIGLALHANMGRDTVNEGDTVDLHRMIVHVRDRYWNFVAPASAAAIDTLNGLADTTTTYTPQWAIRDGTEGDQVTAPENTGWKFVAHKNPTGRGQLRPDGTPVSNRLGIYLFVPSGSPGDGGWFYITVR